jgi:DNA replication protein DnaC
MNARLTEILKRLRLSGLAESLPVRLHEAASNRLEHGEFLELLLQDEVRVREHRAMARATKAAGFRDQKTLEDFDWDFNRGIKKAQISELATGRFVREQRNALLVGPPGVGKIHLSQAIGRCLIRSGWSVLYRSIFDVVRDLLHDEAYEGHDRILSRYLKPDLLILDDMGMKQLPKRSGEWLLEIILRRHEARSTLMMSNRPLEDWGKLIGVAPSATAILDRLLENSEVIQMTGKSYRLWGPQVRDRELGSANSKTQADARGGTN